MVACHDKLRCTLIKWISWKITEYHAVSLWRLWLMSYAMNLFLSVRDFYCKPKRPEILCDIARGIFPFPYVALFCRGTAFLTQKNGIFLFLRGINFFGLPTFLFFQQLLYFSDRFIFIFNKHIKVSNKFNLDMKMLSGWSEII